MTESEWLAATDPAALLAQVQRQARDWLVRLRSWLGGGERGRLERKARLFACACCRLIGPLLVEPRLWRAVDVAERFADGQARAAELEVARAQAAESVRGAAARAATRAAWAAPWQAAAEVAREAAAATEWAAEGDDWRAVGDTTRRAECVLLRDLFGNPFRPVSVPRRAAWRTDPAVVEEAVRIYQKHDFETLPRLAERLLGLGCDLVALLEHLTGPGPHARGCWALDALLGMEG
jgi:hypothetical protein